MCCARLLILCLPLLLLTLAAVASVGPPEPVLPIPSRNQFAWQDMETNLFVHFTVNTFTGKEWGDGQESERVLNPRHLDCRQWARAARAGGFKMMILTAKHHDGFCLWPSRCTDHSVARSPWRNGKGDVVREFVDAARRESIKVGLYLSPWDRHEPSYGDSPAYNEHYLWQLEELLTHYGPISEVWFDGACGEGPNGKKQEYDWQAYWALVRRLQPDAVIFSDAGPDVRWIGNEKGVAGDPCWSMIDPARAPAPGEIAEGGLEALNHGDIHGTVWRPGECDVSIRPGWFWHPHEDSKVRSVENLVDLYFQSVGRNSLLLLNVPPNEEGLFCDTDVERLRDFRRRLDSIFRTDLAAGKRTSASNVRGNDARFGPSNAVTPGGRGYWAADDGITSAWLEVDLGEPTRINVARIEEPIELGQRVIAYRIDCWRGGEWRTVVKGTTVGRKKLDRFPRMTTTRVRLVIEEARACPCVRSLGLYVDPERP